MATGDPPLPMVVSSNRFHDIGPYCNILYREDPMRWGGIMPWEFPQSAGREEEEVFLLKEFGQQEVHVQGGASGDGLGFKFLKQVWYSVAIYNWETRIQCVCDGWFDSNKDLLASMKDYATKPEANVDTFFYEPEVKMYGRKFLEVAVKIIQQRLSRPDDFSTKAEATETTAEPRSGKRARTAPSGITAPDAAQAGQITGTPSLAPAGLQPSAAPFNNNRTFSQPLSSFHQQTPAVRDHNQHSYTPHGQPYQTVQTFHHRGARGKRHSTHDRQGQRPPQGLATPKFSVEPPSYAMSQASSSEVPPPPVSAYRSPSGGPPMPASHPLYQPGFPIPPNQHPILFNQGMQSLQMLPNRQPGAAYPPITGPPFPGAGPGPYSAHHGAQDGRRAGFEPSSAQFEYPHEPHNDHRRDSTSSRGGRAMGYHSNRARGRGAQARRESFGHPGYEGNLQSSSRRFSEGLDRRGVQGDHQKGQWYGAASGELWRPPVQNENANPGLPRKEEFLPQRRRQVSTSTDTTLTMAPQGSRAHDTSGRTHSRSTHYNNDVSKCGCSRHTIGHKCTAVRKVIMFSIPDSVLEHQLLQFLGQFGTVDGLFRAKSLNMNVSTPPWYATFSNSEGARRCLEHRSKEVFWHPEQSFQVELSKEYWDRTHLRFKDASEHIEIPDSRSVWPAAENTPSSSSRNVGPPPAGLVSGDPKQSGAQSESKDIVPKISTSSTPKQNKKRNQYKKSAASKLGAADEYQGDTPEGDRTVSRQGISPIPEETNTSKSDLTSTRRGESSHEEDQSQLQNTHPAFVGTQNDARASITNDKNQESTPAIAAKGKAVESETKDNAGPDLEAHSRVDKQSDDEPVDDSFHTADCTPKQKPELAPSDSNHPAASQEQTKSSPQLPEVDESLTGTKDTTSVAESNIHDSERVDQETATPHDIKVSPDDMTSSKDKDRAPITSATGSTMQASPKSTSEAKPTSEAKLKKTPKLKGPAQTESLGLFVKPKPKKKPKAAKGSSKATGASTPPLSVSDDLSFSNDLTKVSGAENAEDAAVEVEEGEPVPEPPENEYEHEREGEVKVAEVSASSGQFSKVQQSQGWLRSAAASLTGVFAGGPSHSPEAKVVEQSNENEESDLPSTKEPDDLISPLPSAHTEQGPPDAVEPGSNDDDKQAGAPDPTHAEAAPMTPTEEVGSSKKAKKKKKSKTSRNSSIQVISMSHPGHSNEFCMPMRYKTAAKPQVQAQTHESGGDSSHSGSPTKVIAPLPQPSKHLIEGPVIRRKHKRVQIKGSDESSSTELAVRSNAYDGGERKEDTTSPMIFIFGGHQSDSETSEVDRSKQRLSELAEQEARIKAQKMMRIESGKDVL